MELIINSIKKRGIKLDMFNQDKFVKIYKFIFL